MRCSPILHRHSSSLTLFLFLSKLVSAFLKAFQDGCDVINLSLGGPSAFTYSSPLSYLIDQAWGNGVATTLAAGNSGDEGTCRKPRRPVTQSSAEFALS